MLHKPEHALRPTLEVETGAVTDALRSVLTMMRRHWPLFVVLPLIGLGAAIAYLLVTPPIYVAQATMVIDARRVQRFQQQQPTSDEGPDAVAVQTQLEMLKSDSIATTVVKALGLGSDPEFVHDRGSFSDRDADAIAASAVLQHLGVGRVPSTYAMVISVQSLSPAKAARIANAVVDAYVTDQLDAKFQSTRRASLWLQDRLGELRAQASAADKAVADYKAANNIVAADGRLMNEQQLSEINSQLASARAATAEAKARLDRIEDVLQQPMPDASTTEALHNEIIMRLRQQILDLQARQQLFTLRYGAKHQATLNLADEIAGLQRNITDEMHKVAESARSDYAVAQAREEALAKRLDTSVTEAASTNQSLVRLRELQSAAQSSRTIYDNFLQRYMDAVQQESFPSTEARLITPATPPTRPSKPSHVGVIGAALMGSVLAGFGIAALRDVLEGVFRSADQVERALGLRCLATLPHLKASQFTSAARVPRPPKVSPPGKRTIVELPPISRFAIDVPYSPFAEGLRAAKVVIDRTRASSAHAIVGIVSTLPNEGKTIIAINLAQMIAHAGHRVLLVDADLRSPSLSRMLAPDADAGLADVAAGRRSLADCIRIDPASNLEFLPACAPGKLLHTNEILGAAAMRDFFAAVRDRFDYIIVDLSPLAPVVDARTTARFIDGYIVAIEWGTTKIEIVEQVLRDAREIYDAALGVVLTKADLAVLGRYDRHRGAGYHRRFYRRFGYVT